MSLKTFESAITEIDRVLKTSMANDRIYVEFIDDPSAYRRQINEISSEHTVTELGDAGGNNRDTYTLMFE